MTSLVPVILLSVCHYHLLIILVLLTPLTTHGGNQETEDVWEVFSSYFTTPPIPNIQGTIDRACASGGLTYITSFDNLSHPLRPSSHLL